jgi:hypothetical protein
MRVWNEDKDFLAVLLEDPDITRVLTEAEIRSVVNPELQLRNVDTIFSRVLTASGPCAVGPASWRVHSELKLAFRVLHN